MEGKESMLQKLEFMFAKNNGSSSLIEESEKKPIMVGPWGGQNGLLWDDGVYSNVRQLVIVHGVGIHSIQIEYDKKGSSVWSEKHGGGTGGSSIDKVKLDHPDEFMTSIHGHYGSLNEWGPVFIRSLTFESNKRTYGPFGVEQGMYFSFPMTGGKIVGFHGKCHWYLDAIGVYLKPLQKPNKLKSTAHSQSYVNNGTDQIGYAIVQGTADKSYDDYGHNLSYTLSRQFFNSTDFSDSESKKSKVISIEKMPSIVDGPITYGPQGGNGGTIFDDGIHTGIRQINLSRNVGIVSIKVLYDQNGQAKWGNKHGGTGGYKSDKIGFDYPYEILTHITGYHGPPMLMGYSVMKSLVSSVIKSLTFHTTKGKYGPFGEEEGTPFSTNMKEGKIVGFHGRKGLFIDAIGVHVIEGKLTPPLRSPSNSLNPRESAVSEVYNPQWSNKLVVSKRGPSEEVACGVIKEPAPCGPGPWGGDGGRPWDDGVFTGIRQIFLTRAEAICSIQIEYDRNGQSVWSVKHGGNGGDTTHRVKLEFPHEVLVCVCGYYGPITKEERPAIKSLTFHTSRGKYGPFGEEIGTFFTSTTTEGKAVGFHGRSSLYLDAIGVHMQHWLGHHKPTSQPSLFKLFDFNLV